MVQERRHDHLRAGQQPAAAAAQVVQEEPTDTVDPTTLGFWASVGIQKGKPFAPDERMKPGVANLDAAAFFFFLATGVTPAMDTKIVGEGSTYPWAAVDSNGNPLEGAKSYKLHLPPNVPVKTFWSAIVYSAQTRSMIQTDQRFPSVSSQNKDLLVNPDGSVDVYFGPTAPAGKEPNWIQTIPGQSWFMILRLYGPLQPWFDKTWQPGEIEPVS